MLHFTEQRVNVFIRACKHRFCCPRRTNKSEKVVKQVAGQDFDEQKYRGISTASQECNSRYKGIR